MLNNRQKFDPDVKKALAGIFKKSQKSKVLGQI